MRAKVWATIVFLLGAAQTVFAQSPLDQTIGRDDLGRPLEFRAFTTQEIGGLARAAHVPIGFEMLPRADADAGRTPASIVLTGRTVREAVAMMTARDSRYAAREEDGVLVFEPAEPIAPQPLDSPAPAVRFDQTTARDGLALAAALLGAPRSTDIFFGDVKPLALDAPAGTVRSLLNAVVRAHGELVWVLERTPGRDAMFPYTLMFVSGANGFGLGLSGRPPAEAVDLSRFVHHANTADAVLDRVVGTRRDGYALRLTSMYPSALWDLCRITGVPFGLEVLPNLPAGYWPREFIATGRTTRVVLDALVAADPRYEWRMVDGTIVVRPAAAWGDATDPLFTLVRDVDVQDVPITQAVRAVASALGAEHADMSLGDSKIVSLSVVHGTALDVLNALVRAHGELAWSLERAEPDEVKRTGATHRVTIYGSGSGIGFLVRLR